MGTLITVKAEDKRIRVSTVHKDGNWAGQEIEAHTEVPFDLASVGSITFEEIEAPEADDQVVPPPPEE